jgi:succinate dehydrogenase / fumarate reductase cytochrome b subunit
MLALIGMHITSATLLYLQSRAARTTRYTKEESISFTYASRTMRWGGVIILLYIIYHLLHMTVGAVHPDFVHDAVYHNLIIGFQNPVVVGAYTVATLALGMHLYHGLWSIFQTLGASHPRYDDLRRPFAAVLTFIMVGGFLSVPWAVLMGILR